MTDPSSQGYATGLYAASDLFLLRAPVLPADTFAKLRKGAPAPVPPGAPDSTAALADARSAGRRTLRELAALPRVHQAIQVASPSLAAALSGLDDGARQYAALHRYLIRMSTRPTPMGLFAGVAAGTFENDSRSGIAMVGGDPVRMTRTRADSAWLGQVVEQIERDPAARDSLRVRVNALLHRFGTAVALVKLADEGEAERIELTITGPTAVALELAEHNPTFGELAAGLAHSFPAAPAEKIRRLLDRLTDLGVLLADLLPAPTEPLPEIHLLKRLIDQGVRTGAVHGLTRMRQLADDVDRCAGRCPAAVARLEAHQRAMTPAFTGPTFQLDTALALERTTMPADIGAAAVDAAELLMRLGCEQQRFPHIADYHQVFVEAYGIDSELPLLDVLSPETGLGPPNEYRQPSRRLPWPQQPGPVHPNRDRALVELAVHAARDGRFAVDLDDELVDRLTAWRPDEGHSRPRTAQDLLFQLAADSPEAIRDGRWRLVLSAVGNYGGWQGFSRFFDLFDEATVARVRDQQRLQEALRPDALFAELNYSIRHSRGGNLSSHPPTRGYEVCVNTAPTGPPVQQIALSDIMIGADGNHFYLRSRSLGRDLVVTQSYAVSPHRAPNICRALLEFSADGYTPLCLFHWGVAARAPFLPRLTRGNIVLAPARWTIGAATFPDSADPDDFFRACQRWRRRWQVPRYTYLIENAYAYPDNQLLLDLDHPMWVDELYGQVTRLRNGQPSPAGSIQLHEALPGPEDLWLRDRDGRPYHAEFVVPLVLKDRTRMPEPTAVRAVAPQVTTRRWLPGDEWTHLKLYAAAELHDGIIAGPLRALLTDERFEHLVDRWFFIRYADPLPHLRLRFHTPDPNLAADAMSLCATWARDLVARGQATDLAFCSYDREVERYGGGHAIDWVETAFCANSETAVELVRLLHNGRGRFDPDVVCVAALHELYRVWGAGPPPPDGGRGGAHIDDAARKRFRELRPLLCEVLAPGERRPDPRAPQYRAALEPVFGRQRAALAAAGRRVRELAARRLLTGSEHNVIESLAHIQSIRLIGPDRERERLCRALRSLSLRAIRNRPAGQTCPESAAEPQPGRKF
jgi:lantibiotic biosynthesis protein